MSSTTQKKILVNCPICRRSVAWDKSSLFRPFCSERCQLMDLGAWANESYTISDEAATIDPDQNARHNED